jgi:hypothetical protein
VTTHRDRSNRQGRTIGEQERVVFLQLTTHLLVEDFFDHVGPVIYSWGNKRRQGSLSMLRLDRFHTFANPNGAPNSHIKEYKI